MLHTRAIGIRISIAFAAVCAVGSVADRLAAGLPGEAAAHERVLAGPGPTEASAGPATAQPPGASGTSPAPVPTSQERLFDRIKNLEGTWQGKSTKGWTERIEYKTIAAGSCVMETSFDAHPSEMMVTMIHLDGPDKLVLTHYCVAKNEPRLRATAIADDLSSVTFEFMDATNLPSRDAGHMDKVVFRFKDADHFTSRWTWYQKGAEQWLEEIEHERVPTRSADPVQAPSDAGHTHH